MSTQGKIVKVSGPLVIAEGIPGARMYDVVRVGRERLIGEVLEIRGEKVSIQVYEETGGLKPGEPVESTYQPLSVELAPGLLGNIYDGIQRPLDLIRAERGDFIERGIEMKAIDREKEWEFEPRVREGEEVTAGDILGTVQETEIVEHRIMVPFGIKGKVVRIHSGKAKVEDVVAVIKTPQGEEKKICMLTRWPVRKMRPYRQQLAPKEPLITGQRVIDTFFPIAKGGTACIPGPFGSGKTVIQHQLSKWADADIIIFVGCGERGNEMADVLRQFPKLKDPRTGKSLMQRTILIANTSNMPVAARESSIYTGITLAEYYRDMGYNVALMADSTSRWAEALREMSGRLEEIPGEEGYPAYLSSRLAEFYERAGRVICLGKDGREASLTAIGAVSPPGGDLSEPVTQATLRVVRVFWALVSELAYQRHFPAIHWLRSYSLYIDNLRDYFAKEVASDWMDLRNRAIALLQREDELKETVRLVGLDVLSDEDRIAMETARSLREDFLQQFAFHEVDTYSPIKKQYLMLRVILKYYDLSLQALKRGASLDKLISLPVREDIARMKYIPNENVEREIGRIEQKLKDEIEELVKVKIS
ncbi:V-type ATP synthase subunit A [Candidatus Aerophobetes bacterium]|uniref:V-type ATP synthase alpha chain n=1 Tax=Aerophobetes bacterium TaxID=2030807 RepID=A0A497E4S5_UNCAE|nr:MAG: V-type ATP synthase subunit A [Candidatus Aerophobetes bacterium]